MISSRYTFPLRLIAPSFFSGTACTILAAIILGSAAWTYIYDNQLFYEYFFGRFGIVTSLLASSRISAWQESFAHNSVSYLFFIVTIAALVGLFVYVLLLSSSRIFKEIRFIWQAQKENNEFSRAVLHEAIIHASVRAGCVIAWLLYWLFFMSTALPTCVLMLQSGIDSINMAISDGWGQIALSIVLLWLCLHLNVIFARLSFLRLRLF